VRPGCSAHPPAGRTAGSSTGRAPGARTARPTGCTAPAGTPCAPAPRSGTAGDRPCCGQREGRPCPPQPPSPRSRSARPSPPASARSPPAWPCAAAPRTGRLRPTQKRNRYSNDKLGLFPKIFSNTLANIFRIQTIGIVQKSAFFIHVANYRKWQTTSQAINFYISKV